MGSGRSWYSLNDHAGEDLFQTGNKFLEFLENAFTIGVVVSLERSLEYLRAGRGILKVTSASSKSL
jgi:hypothetical protein